MTTTPNPDRAVHGRTPNGAEIVRYARSGKWWREGDGSRIRLMVSDAAALAADGEWFEKRPGGEAFDRLVRQLTAEKTTRPGLRANGEAT